MNVRRASLLEGARSVTGAAVIIDVYRAFTTAAFCIAAGAREIVLVSTPDEALRLAARDPSSLVAANPNDFLTGEVDGRPIAGFDAGNSPTAILGLDLSGRRVIQRSSSGTQGVVAATAATEILLGGFVTASATCRYLAARAEEITLVAMGDAGTRPAPEDEACADYLEALLRGGSPMRPSGFVARPDWTSDRTWPEWFPRTDAELACEIDRFDFALPVVREDGLLVARPVRA